MRFVEKDDLPDDAEIPDFTIERPEVNRLTIEVGQLIQTLMEKEKHEHSVFDILFALQFNVGILLKFCDFHVNTDDEKNPALIPLFEGYDFKEKGQAMYEQEKAKQKAGQDGP